jgi:hypothetical protein
MKLSNRVYHRGASKHVITERVCGQVTRLVGQNEHTSLTVGDKTVTSIVIWIITCGSLCLHRRLRIKFDGRGKWRREVINAVWCMFRNVTLRPKMKRSSLSPSAKTMACCCFGRAFSRFERTFLHHLPTRPSRSFHQHYTLDILRQ